MSLEESQSTTVDALITKITQYGSRSVQDFDKYQALHLAEQLASVAKSTAHEKATNFDFISASLREKMHCLVMQFKAYFLALLADKEFTKIIDTISKVDKSFARLSSQSARSGRGARFSPYNTSRVDCFT